VCERKHTFGELRVVKLLFVEGVPGRLVILHRSHPPKMIGAIFLVDRARLRINRARLGTAVLRRARLGSGPWGSLSLELFLEARLHLAEALASVGSTDYSQVDMLGFLYKSSTLARKGAISHQIVRPNRLRPTWRRHSGESPENARGTFLFGSQSIRAHQFDEPGLCSALKLTNLYRTLSMTT